MAAGSTITISSTRVHARVLIANISRGQLGLPFVGGVIGALTTGEARRLVLVESGPYLDAGRNRAVEQALAQHENDDDPDSPLAWDWLLFIDSDMQFQPADITTLFEPYRPPDSDESKLVLIPESFPVIGGYYVNPYDDGLYPEEGNVGPVVYRWDPELPVQTDSDVDPFYGAFERMSTTMVEAAPGAFAGASPLARVDMIGTGFLAIHSSLIHEMLTRYGQPCPWFDEPIVNGRLYGEDMGFALRVMDMGYPVLLNRACRVAHNKTITLIPPTPATPTGDTPVSGV